MGLSQTDRSSNQSQASADSGLIMSDPMKIRTSLGSVLFWIDPVFSCVSNVLI